MNGSKSFSLGSYEVKKILKGLGIAVAGTLLSYIAVNVIPHLQATDYAWLIPVCSVLVNMAKEWLSNNAPASTQQ